jgi:polysaccharide biosynthesis/export protein
MRMGPAKQVFQLSAMLLLLGAWTMAQTNSVQAPAGPGKNGSMLSPVAPGQNGTGLRSVNGGEVPGAGVGASSESFPARVAPLAPDIAATSSAPSAEYLIGTGDLLEVSVYGAPEYLKQVRVSSNGEITLPLCGAVKVGGMTPAQAEDVIAKKLSDGGFFNDPRVSVLEKEFATQGISVLGEVQKPGIYPLPGSRSLFDALSAAGGTTPRAGTVISVTHRSDPQNPKIVTLSYDGKNAQQTNIPVYPGDTVMVSKAGVVYVTGDVKVPGGFIMENAHMTILQAVAMAQGTNPTAAVDRARLIRSPGPGKSPQDIPISLKKILSAKAPDVNLQPNDIVFVPSSAAKSAGRRTIDAIVQTATGMAVFGRMP